MWLREGFLTEEWRGTVDPSKGNTNPNPNPNLTLTLTLTLRCQDAAQIPDIIHSTFVRAVEGNLPTQKELDMCSVDFDPPLLKIGVVRLVWEVQPYMHVFPADECIAMEWVL